MKKYFICTGYNKNAKLPPGLEYFELNAGIFALIVSELELNPKQTITNNLIEEKILSQGDFDKDYKGHELFELLNIFPDIFISEITDQYFGNKDNIEQLISVFLASNKDFLYLNYSSQTLDNLKDIAFLNSPLLKYENILQALISSQFKFAFLDLYRCIEQLYQIIYIEDIHTQLRLDSRKIELLKIIDDKLSWKPIERNSLKKIIDETPFAFKENLYSSIKKISGQGCNYDEWLYGLRCSVVHLKTFQKELVLNEKEWDNIIKGICKVIYFWYDKFSIYQ